MRNKLLLATGIISAASFLVDSIYAPSIINHMNNYTQIPADDIVLVSSILFPFFDPKV